MDMIMHWDNILTSRVTYVINTQCDIVCDIVSIHYTYKMKQPSILQYLKSLVVFFMELTWIKVVQCRKNLCNEVNHTKTSHDRFGEVFCNAATCLIRPNIFGPQVTALDRFHCILMCSLGYRAKWDSHNIK